MRLLVLLVVLAVREEQFPAPEALVVQRLEKAKTVQDRSCKALAAGLKTAKKSVQQASTRTVKKSVPPVLLRLEA